MLVLSRLAVALVGISVVPAVWSACPFQGSGPPPADHPVVSAKTRHDFLDAASKVDFAAVKTDLRVLMTNSQEKWPADFGHYGGLMIRLAWHCSGSYRSSDGRGGCDGARVRFDPERSWEDNTNLDKARDLLLPIKLRYGFGLSWGDLIVLAGNVAIESMGGPVLGFCGGRFDAADGSSSVELGPSSEQEAMYPCEVQGNCTSPLGSVQVGLIYVNPEGPMGNPDPAASAAQIREVFGRMGMNDSETVALVGGGHAFGKTHGACPNGAGHSPKENPAHPWPGLCGTGKGNDTFTSGFEVVWSETPTEWSNSYFRSLHEQNFTKYKGPAGHWQWHVANATGSLSYVSMLTSDVALMYDPKGEYQKLVESFATNIDSLNYAFSHAWYKLTTRDMGPHARCVGDDVPPPQPFQNPLPNSPSIYVNYKIVRSAVKAAMLSALEQSQVPLFLTLAWRCAWTYRATDFSGGCNGARLRFLPESGWSSNDGLAVALNIVRPVKEVFSGVSWADLIVLAGNAAVEHAGNIRMKFCGGRVDAEDGSGSPSFEPLWANAESGARLKNAARVMGLSNQELVALAGGRRSIETSNGTALSADFLRTLLTEQWETVAGSVTYQYKAKGKDLFATKSDLALRQDGELSAIAADYASDSDKLVSDFVRVWAKIMDADRYVAAEETSCIDDSSRLLREAESDLIV